MVADKPKMPRVGDVVEISLSSGFAYALFTHKHKRYGALVRVVEQIYEKRPASFDDLVDQRGIQFSTFFPLGAACKQGITHVVAHIPIPPSLREFPVFRARATTPQGQGPWWLWDGEREWLADTPDSELVGLPIRGIWNDTLLVERIEAGWRATDVPA